MPAVVPEILTGVFIVLVAAVIIYIFKMRQLYLVNFHNFHYGPLSDDGRVIELLVFNRSRSTEEDIVVELLPELKYSVVAFDSADTDVTGSQIRIKRIPPFSEFSVILLAEGSFIPEKIVSIFSSKAIKGKIIDKIEHVPSPYWNLCLYPAILGCLLCGVWYAAHSKITENYNELINEQTKIYNGRMKIYSRELDEWGAFFDSEYVQELLKPRLEPAMQGKTNGDLLQWAISLRHEFRLAELDKQYLKRWIENKIGHGIGVPRNELPIHKEELYPPDNIIPPDLHWQNPIPDSTTDLLR